ncbi:MAG: hypothetical protein DME24_23290 [Verrucomicrobia bacterium]|nr:MAG: hypothetical protein DME24_23290 [Verrucomicrobiota bacterium]
MSLEYIRRAVRAIAFRLVGQPNWFSQRNFIGVPAVSEWKRRSSFPAASVGMSATGDGAIPKAGKKGAAGSSGATKPSSQRKAPGNCLALQPERARAEQSKQHGRRGARRRGAERVLVPATCGFCRNLWEFATWFKSE